MAVRLGAVGIGLFGDTSPVMLAADQAVQRPGPLWPGVQQLFGAEAHGGDARLHARRGLAHRICGQAPPAVAEVQVVEFGVLQVDPRQAPALHVILEQAYAQVVGLAGVIAQCGQRGTEPGAQAGGVQFGVGGTEIGEPAAQITLTRIVERVAVVPWTLALVFYPQLHRRSGSVVRLGFVQRIGLKAGSAGVYFGVAAGDFEIGSCDRVVAVKTGKVGLQRLSAIQFADGLGHDPGTVAPRF